MPGTKPRLITSDTDLDNSIQALDVRDAAPLSEAERQMIVPRIDVLCLAHPALTVPAFLALHGAIFKPVYALAGQARTVPLALDGAQFARPTVIIPSLAARFAKLAKAGGFADLPRAAFFDALAHHISELHAIMPFRSGNRRALAVHSAQLALAAGHDLDACIKGKSVWDDALSHSFFTCDHSQVTEALLGAAQSQLDISGPTGLPLLPPRDATVSRRYSVTLSKAGSLLREHIAAATAEAAIIAERAAPNEIAAAGQELAFLRHPKGPLFQIRMLASLGTSKILVVIHEGQSPLELCREIATAVLIELGEYPQPAVVQASVALDGPAHSAGGSPHQDRLAAEFLANSAHDNLADPRFAAAQRAVDRAVANASRASGGNSKHINAAIAKARSDIAARIRKGDAFDKERTSFINLPRHAQPA